MILTMLAHADAVIASMEGDEGALSRAGDSAVWLQMSTIRESGTERCADLAHRHGPAFVDAPVLGTKQSAETGELVVMASGPQQLRERLGPILDAVGRKTIYLRMKAKAIAAREFEPSFSLRLGAKDAGLVEEAARRRQLDLPLTGVIRRRLEQGVAEHGDEDISATYWTSAPRRSTARS